MITNHSLAFMLSMFVTVHSDQCKNTLPATTRVILAYPFTNRTNACTVKCDHGKEPSLSAVG